MNIFSGHVTAGSVATNDLCGRVVDFHMLMRHCPVLLGGDLFEPLVRDLPVLVDDWSR